MSLLRVSLANDVGEIRRIGAALIDFLGEEGAPPRAIHGVRLVVEELVVNIIRYAYDDAKPHRIDVEVRTEPQRAVVTVEDDGKPFDPCGAPAPPLREPLETRPRGGLGIYLVRQMSKEMTYTRHGDRNRVRVVVEYATPKESATQSAKEPV
jgi:anti-sigma regulatory factor (Ser/Thr protein kinase)